MARGTQVKSNITAAQPAGFDLPRAQPPVFSDFSTLAETELTNALAAFDPETIEPEQDAEELGYTPTVYTQTISSQDYGSAPTYETPDEALANYNALLEEVQQQQQQTASVYNYNNYDPGDFARAGFSGPSSVAGQAASDRIAEYLRENDIPPSIEVDGQTLFFTTGVGENALAQTLGDDYRASGSYDVYGPPGTYSTVYVPSESVFAGINPYLRAALGVATGGLSEAFISATNVISGEADTSDWINVALGGVNLAQQSGSGGFTASSGSPITGTTAPRTLAEMAEAGDIVSITGGLGGIAEEEGEGENNLAAILTAINNQLGEELFPTGTTPGRPTGSQDTDLNDPDKEGIDNTFNFDPDIPPPVLPKEPTETAASAAAAAAQAAEAAGASKAAAAAAAQAAYDAVMNGADAAAAAEAGANAAAGFEDTGGDTDTTTGTGGDDDADGLTDKDLGGNLGEDPDSPVRWQPQTEQILNPDFNPDTMDSVVLRQVYEAVLRGELSVDDYVKMGGKHRGALERGVSSDDVYSDYPPEYIEQEVEQEQLTEDDFNSRYEDGFLGGFFDALDFDGDGFVQAGAM